MDFLSKIMQWLADLIKFTLNVLWNYPKLWICTYIIKKRIKACTEVVIDANKAYSITQAAVASDVQCRIELTDSLYVLPKKEWIEYINNNLWIPYKKIKRIGYNKDYDCDNFASSFFTMVQELGLGLCIGIAHYGFTKEDGKYVAHAVSCFIPVEDQNFWLIEPQADGCEMWALDKNVGDLFFVYLEGRQTF